LRAIAPEVDARGKEIGFQANGLAQAEWATGQPAQLTVRGAMGAYTGVGQAMIRAASRRKLWRCWR